MLSIIREVAPSASIGFAGKARYFLIKKTDIGTALEVLKNNGFDMLIDLFAADFVATRGHFEIVYNLLNLYQNKRLTIKVLVEDGEKLPSVCSVFACADWYEREVFDMFGIYFEGHANMRRILMDDGFVGHPLRKDFPVTGYTQVKYDQDLGCVVHEPAHFPEEYRDFDFTSPWKGPSVLPGDEKGNFSK